MRRPEPAEHDVGERRQMTFLPERMRQQRHHGDEVFGEDSSDEDLSEHSTPVEEYTQSTPVDRRTGRKRQDLDVEDASESDKEPATSSYKRRKRSNVPTGEPSRALRRQSTMTQFADGPRPSLAVDEPDFKPTKRRSKTSWGGTDSIEGGRDLKQRTLTQMIPGIGRLSKEELEELSDLDADLEEDEKSQDAVSQSLIEQGLLEGDAPARMIASVRGSGELEGDTMRVQTASENQSRLPAALKFQSSIVVQSVEATTDDHDEEDYHPTQFIEAPTVRTRQTPRRASARKNSYNVAEPKRTAKSRFSLLSTPEKRRVFEIPSSQSPTESVLSTQISPDKVRRSALGARTSNAIIVTETPSKRRHVTFKEPSVQPVPPPRLRKFESTIQDSEDEEESDLESNAAEQAPADSGDQVMYGHPIGAETQAVLDQIDLACTNDEEDILPDSQRPSGSAEQHIVRDGPYQPSPELGESWAPVIYDDDGPEFESYRSSRSGGKSQLVRDADIPKDSLPIFNQTTLVSQLDLTTQAPLLSENISSTPPALQPQSDVDLPSTPMVIRDDSADEEEAEHESSPPCTAQHKLPQQQSTLFHQSTDLDGEPVQVPRSPSLERETQQSHSSKAEQQLRNEWLSYSQYVHARAPQSSSMHGAADAFSFHNTLQQPRTDAVSSSARMQHSQATTVDEVTPKKNRTQQAISMNTTPHRFSKSQPFLSPEKPPSLFIPSSFPSPSRAALESWSSPVAVRTQNMYGSSQAMDSLEDFSIPLPPPTEGD